MIAVGSTIRAASWYEPSSLRTRPMAVPTADEPCISRTLPDSWYHCGTAVSSHCWLNFCLSRSGVALAIVPYTVIDPSELSSTLLIGVHAYTTSGIGVSSLRGWCGGG